jgi:hypothetical protein
VLRLRLLLPPSQSQRRRQRRTTSARRRQLEVVLTPLDPAKGNPRQSGPRACKIRGTGSMHTRVKLLAGSNPFGKVRWNHTLQLQLATGTHNWNLRWR